MNPTYLVHLLLLSLMVLSCQTKKQGTELLFEQNFHPYPNVLVKLSKEAPCYLPYEQFFKAYRDKDYSQALAISDNIQNLPADDPLQLYRAVCLMALEQYETAVPVLKNLAAAPGEYQDAARWYWSLALLKLGKIEACKNQLIELQNQSTYIRNEAKVLIGKLP